MNVQTFEINICIPDSYPIIEVAFIIQAMNQGASSSSFSAGIASPFVTNKKIIIIIETHLLFNIKYGIFSFLSLQSVSLDKSLKTVTG